MIYVFNGAVAMWDNIVCRKWFAETTAESKQKAISNLKYRFRKQNNLCSSVPLNLIGEVLEK